MSIISSDKAAQLLLEQDDILILCHRYPDGDAIGSAFALCRALRMKGKRANVTCCDLMPEKYGFIFNGIEPVDSDDSFIVSVDVADPSLLGRLEKEYAHRINLCIDHHYTNSIQADYRVIDAHAAATGEIIFRMLPALGVELDQDIARAVYTAISTDTGCFRYSNVTSETMRIAAVLLDTGIDAYAINKVMFEQKTRARFRIEQELISNIQFCYDSRMAIITLSKQLVEDTGVEDGDIDGLSAIPLTIEGVDLGIMMREIKGGYKISVRTSPAVNACEFCRTFGGGGHPAAAGCSIFEPYDEAKQKLIDNAESFLLKQVPADTASVNN